MNISELQPGEGVMRYKSPYLLKRESDELEAWFAAEIAKSERVIDLAKAMLDSNGEALVKCAPRDLASAKADLHGIKEAFGEEARKFGDGFLKSLLPGWHLASIMREYTRRTAEIDDETKRSRRLNDLWATETPNGPWSAPTLH